LGENLRFAMAIPARLSMRRPVTPTVPARGIGSQSALGICSIQSRTQNDLANHSQ
jgi:hypothetical protein